MSCKCDNMHEKDTALSNNGYTIMSKLQQEKKSIHLLCYYISDQVKKTNLKVVIFIGGDIRCVL